MTTVNGFPISNALIEALQRNTHNDLNHIYTQFETYSDQIVEITYKLIELMDADDTLGEVQKIKGFLINLGYMREVMIDLNLSILEGFKKGEKS